MVRERMIFKVTFLGFFSLAITDAWAESRFLIFHAHNMNYQEIIDKIPQLAQDGFTHIQVSPPQKSSDFLPRGIINNSYKICLQTPAVDHISQCTAPLSAEAIKNHLAIRWDQVFTEQGERVWPKKVWWLHYQPIEYTLGQDTFGTLPDLHSLSAQAYSNNIDLIADLIVTHTAAPPLTDASDWAYSLIGCKIAEASNPNDKDPSKHWWVKEGHYKLRSISQTAEVCSPLKELYQSKLIPICNSIMNTTCDETMAGNWKLNHYFYPWQYGHNVGGWPCGGGCAALMTLNKDVIKAQQRYVDDLFMNGFKGIRLDAASSAPEETVAWIQRFVKKGNGLFYSEIVPSRKVLSERQGNRPYLLGNPITDYTFMSELKNSLKYGGHWQGVVNYINSTLKDDDIVFCETHDTLGGELKGFKMHDVIDRQNQIHDTLISDDHLLGEYLILAMGKGIPLILNSYLDEQYLRQHYRNIYYDNNAPAKSVEAIIHRQREAFQFHALTRNYKTEFAVMGDILVIYKKDQNNDNIHGFAVLNKTMEEQNIPINHRVYKVPARDALFVLTAPQ